MCEVHRYRTASQLQVQHHPRQKALGIGVGDDIKVEPEPGVYRSFGVESLVRTL